MDEYFGCVAKTIEGSTSDGIQIRFSSDDKTLAWNEGSQRDEKAMLSTKSVKMRILSFTVNYNCKIICKR